VNRLTLQQFLMPVWALIFAFAAADQASAADAVIYRLKWLKNMSTAGDLVADSLGYFEKAGLSVTVKAGGPERDALRELELGHAHFGVASADQVIRARAKGAPVVVIAQLFQVNPLQWIYHMDGGAMGGPGDLENKTIGVTFGKNDEIIMRTLIAGAGIKETSVRLFSVRLDYTPFYKGRVDLWPVYINTQGIEIGEKLKRAGVAVGFFDPSDHGVRFVANSVVTSRRMMEKDSTTVRRFLGALLEGWRFAMDPDNAGRTVTVVQGFDRDSKKAVLEAQLEATRKLVRPSSDTVIGAIDVPAWLQTETIMLTHGQIDAPVKVGDILMPLSANQ
jgi:NitT/TauT family transport system substrate-binding protein